MTDTNRQRTTDQWVVGPEPITGTDLAFQIHKVVPEEEHQFIISLRQQLDAWYWDLGDAANRWYEFVVANDVPATKLDVCGVLAHELDDDRIGAEAISNYADLAAFYDVPDLRQDLSVLPMSHLRYAMSWGETYAIVIDRDFLLMGKNHGHPVSLKRLRATFELEEHQHQEHNQAQLQDEAPLPDGLSPIPGDLSHYIQTQPTYTPPARPVKKTDVISQARADIADLRALLPRLQRKNPQAASTIGRIIRLTDEALKRLQA